jgi:hypothetical protein
LKSGFNDVKGMNNNGRYQASREACDGFDGSSTEAMTIGGRHELGSQRSDNAEATVRGSSQIQNHFDADGEGATISSQSILCPFIHWSWRRLLHLTFTHEFAQFAQFAQFAPSFTCPLSPIDEIASGNFSTWPLFRGAIGLESFGDPASSHQWEAAWRRPFGWWFALRTCSSCWADFTPLLKVSTSLNITSNVTARLQLALQRWLPST